MIFSFVEMSPALRRASTQTDGPSVSELSQVVEKTSLEIARRQFNRACEAEKVEVKNWSRAF
jgi:hypothetical protein